MYVTQRVRRSAVAAFLLTAICQTTGAAAETPSETKREKDLPSFEAMLATALAHNPQVRAAQAELDRVRLEVAREVRAFRDEWNEQHTRLVDSEAAIRAADRIRSLTEGAVPVARLAEAQRKKQQAHLQAAQAREKLDEMIALLPLLLGAEINEVAAGKEPRTDIDATQADSQPDKPTITAEVEKLLRERLEVLQQITEYQQAAHQRGEGNFDAVAKAQLEVLAVRLQLADSADERIKIRQETIDIAGGLEETTTEMFKAGITSRADMLKAQALRLRAEADLLREQSASRQKE